MNTIRFAAPDDAAALLRIYAQYIETPITFEYTLPSEEEFARRIRDIQAVYPYLVRLKKLKKANSTSVLSMTSKGSTGDNNERVCLRC